MNKKINTLEERIKELETSIKQKKSEKPQLVDNVKGKYVHKLKR